MIDTSTGQINVGTATTLDYEAPTDSDGDNVYELDGAGHGRSRTGTEIRVDAEIVTSQNEPPEFDVPSGSR